MKSSLDVVPVTIVCVGACSVRHPAATSPPRPPPPPRHLMTTPLLLILWLIRYFDDEDEEGGVIEDGEGMRDLLSGVDWGSSSMPQF